MHLKMRLWVLLILIFIQQSAFAKPDARMQIDVVAQKQGVKVRWLHANIQKAATLALPELWSRMIPQHAMDQIPKHVKAIRFLQKAVPNDLGVRIIFNEKRVLSYLKHNNIPYYAEQSDDPVINEAPPVTDNLDHFPLIQEPLSAGLLTIERHESLPEQILFEDYLSHDPRVLSLMLKQVNSDQQQYQLQLKSSDAQWLTAWFSRRGMTLTQSFDGWVAR